MTINGDKQQPTDDNSRSKSIRILYMEDEVGLARLFQRRLEAVGYQVDIARDGQEGLEMYDTDVYDVIVVDYKMPFYNGLEVLGILAQEGPLPPAVMLTGSGDEQTAVMAMKLGAGDYIVKDMKRLRLTGNHFSGYNQVTPCFILSDGNLIVGRLKVVFERHFFLFCFFPVFLFDTLLIQAFYLFPGNFD